MITIHIIIAVVFLFCSGYFWAEHKAIKNNHGDLLVRSIVFGLFGVYQIIAIVGKVQ